MDERAGTPAQPSDLIDVDALRRAYYELKPDVIVLDLAMPKVDGWTVLKHLRESSWTETIPVIVVSAVTSARDEALQLGCDAFLSKPCPPEVVWLQIRALCRVRGQLRHGLDWYERL